MYIKETVKHHDKNPASDSRTDSGTDIDLEVWIVFQDDNPRMIPAVVLGYDIIPPLGMHYFHNGLWDTRFIVTKRHAEKITSGLTHWWKVTLSYEMRGAPDRESPPNENDFSGGVTIRRKLIKIPTVYKSDVLGNLAQNSAGMMFDPPFQRDRYLRGYTITRTEFVNPFIKADMYEQRVNSDSMWGLPPESILVNQIDVGISVVGNQIWYSWDVTYDITIDTGTHGRDKDGEPIYGHRMAALDNGTYQVKEIKPSEILEYGSDVTPILIQGVETEKPVRLDGKGKPLAKDEESVFISLMPYHSENLNELCLPNPYMIHNTY